MSKVIVELENLPKNCYLGCPLQCDHFCTICNRDTTAWLREEIRPDWCPIKVDYSTEDEMSSEDAIKYLENEIACIKRASDNKCDRDCLHCDLLVETKPLLNAYDVAIQALHKSDIHINRRRGLQEY